MTLAEAIVAMTSVDLDADLLKRAREVSGERTNRAAIEVALRRMVALSQKREMIEGILSLPDFAEQFGAPVIEYPAADRD